MGLLDTLRREYVYARGFSRVFRRLAPFVADPAHTMRDEVEEWAAEFGARPALIAAEGDERLTYVGLFAASNRWARWAILHGVAAGDRVALMMPNRPDYVAAWIGIAAAGGVTALINTHLSGEILARTIDAAAPRHVVVDATLLSRFETAAPHLAAAATVWVHGPHAMAYQRIDEALAELSGERLRDADRRPLTRDDDCVWIYTSGTTGLPKPARLNHYRVMAVMHGFAAAAETTRDDRVYVAQPMYHTAGGFLAIGLALTVGGCCVIRDRFSASAFWSDVVGHDCTVAMYIGELCRYLLAAPPHRDETRHRLRLVVGNGLRPEVWQPFVTRFSVPMVLEWFAVTEGNIVLVNFDGRVGSIGRIPRWMESKVPTRIVRVDAERGEPARGPDGRCIRAAPDEIGECIAEIRIDPKNPAQRFDGYADPEASRAKILRDVFVPGDAWFRTGDLMRRDRQGYFYFVDRIGDTFRWKGENVSTTEVSEAIGGLPGVEIVNVYGVAVPDRDGRAGMAALVVGGDFDLDALAARVIDALPDYARPLFVRLREHVELTGTFKLRKVDLAAEGCDPSAIDDPLFVLDATGRRYLPLDADRWAAIVDGSLRL